jgi:hypothetical protein
MTTTPGLVSVIIPTYNRAHCVGRAIRSALAQTYRDVEVIVVDDGSADATAHVVAGFDSRVRSLRQANGGVAAARNTGLRAATGEFIAFLDSDDWWDDWKLSAQIAVLRARPDVGMVWTDMRAIDPAGGLRAPRYLRTMYTAYDDVDISRVCRSVALRELWPAAPDPLGAAAVFAGDLCAHMVLGSLVHTSTVVLRRTWAEQVGEFDATLRVGEDYKYHFATTALGPVALIDAPSINYLVGAADQLTAPGTFGLRLARATLATVTEWCARAPERITLPRRQVTRRFARLYAWLGSEELLTAGDRAAARRHLWQSLRRVPGQPRLIALLLLTLLPAAGLRALRALKQAWRRRGSAPVTAHG